MYSTIKEPSEKKATSWKEDWKKDEQKNQGWENKEWRIEKEKMKEVYKEEELKRKQIEDTAQRANREDGKRTTCIYYEAGKCSKAEANCNFIHEMGWVSGRKLQGKELEEWTKKSEERWEKIKRGMKRPQQDQWSNADTQWKEREREDPKTSRQASSTTEGNYEWEYGQGKGWRGDQKTMKKDYH